MVELRGASVDGIGLVNTEAIISAIIEMSVLVGLASTVTLYVVKLVFPYLCFAGEKIRYRAYASIITEKVDFTRITAQASPAPRHCQATHTPLTRHR